MHFHSIERQTNNKEKQMINESTTAEQQPKGRIYPLGMNELPQGIRREQYMEIALGAKLEFMHLAVLFYLAHRYNFKNRQPTKMSVRRVANDLHMDKKTFIKYKKELEALHWLSIKKGFNNNPDKISLLIGDEIPTLKWKEPEHKALQLLMESENAKDNSEYFEFQE
jgi:hypothetical protein